MRIYGDIETNLNELDLKNLCYSVDSLTFMSPDRIVFNIDFEEGDYEVNGDGVMHFRLKSLGLTFEDEWKKLKLTEGLDLEHDFELFEKCSLESVNMYLYIDEEEYSKVIKNIKIKESKISLHVEKNVVCYTSTTINI